MEPQAFRRCRGRQDHASSGKGAGDKNVLVTYTTGLRSRVEVRAGDYAFAFGNGVILAGNDEIGGSDSESYWAIETGVEVRRTLGFSLADLGLAGSRFGGVRPEAGLYFIHYYFPKALEFSRLRNGLLEVRNQFEFGFTLSSATPWELLWIADPQIGVSYIVGDNLAVLRINFGFPF